MHIGKGDKLAYVVKQIQPNTRPNQRRGARAGSTTHRQTKWREWHPRTAPASSLTWTTPALTRARAARRWRQQRPVAPLQQCYRSTKSIQNACTPLLDRAQRSPHARQHMHARICIHVQINGARSRWQQHAPPSEMLRTAPAHCSRVASDGDDASANTSAGSAPAATTAPRCTSARRSTKSVQSTYTPLLGRAQRSTRHARTAARATAHAPMQLESHKTYPNPCRQHHAPPIEMLRIASAQYSFVASDVDDASADTSAGSAPAATTAPHCAPARRSTKSVQSTQRLFQCVTAAAVSKHQTQTSQRCN